MDKVKALERQLARERRARKAAEKIAEEKTRQLYLTNQELHQRTHALQANAEVSRKITSILDIAVLLKYVVNYLQSEFSYYHVHIYLVNEKRGDLVMIEGSGEVGLSLKNREHWLNFGQGIVGSVAQNNSYFLSNDVSQDPDFFRNPLLPDTRSELAVPLRKGSQVLGVLDIQSENLNAFSMDDVSLMQSIADQTAVAVDNARLLADRQSTILQLQELDRLKTEFLTSMSHELRTPLNSILGFAEILLEGIDGELSDYARNDISLIHNSGEVLLAIINDMLDISKIEAGLMEIVPESLVVSKVMEEIMDVSISLVKGKPVEVTLTIQDGLPEIYADKIRLKQILMNIIGNAIKFTPKGQVTIAVNLISEPLPPMVCFTVIDMGIGIPKDKQKQIFLRFKQADMSKTRIYGGVGLGLAISKKLVEMHHGQIGVRSEVGQGAEFFFTMPLAQEEKPKI